MLLVACLLAIIALTSSVRAAEPAAIGVRGGDHPGFGRVVFDVPPGTQYRLNQDGDHIRVHFDPAQSVSSLAFAPRNVRSVTGGDQDAVVVLAPKVTVHDMRLGDHVVIDVFDPAGPEPGASGPEQPPAHQASRDPPPKERPPVQSAAALNRTTGQSGPASVSAAPALPEPAGEPSRPGGGSSGSVQNPMGRTEPAGAPHEPGKADPASKPVQIPPAQPASPPETTVPAAVIAPLDVAEPPPDPLSLVARLVPPPAGMQGAAFSLPLPETVAAAAFRRGDTDYVVFDDRRPLDLRALRGHKVLGQASVHLLPAATLIRLRLPPGFFIALARTQSGWTAAAVQEPPQTRPIAEDAADGRVRFAAAAPGHVVTLADQETGATLLAGTQLQAGEAVAVRRSGAEFVLWPSWQGVVVEALSDRLSLRAVAQGFALIGEPGALSLSQLAADGLVEGAALTRRFTFPGLPVEMLRQRVASGLRQVASAPILARGPQRQKLAQDMLALGLAPEAETLLRVAAEEDPDQAANPDTLALKAIAALLANRPDEAGGLDDPRLTGSDEIAFWRGMRLALHDDASPEAAAIFAVTAPLVLAYPAAMRDQLAPLVAETMLRGGQAGSAQVFLGRAGSQPGLEMARALAQQLGGNADAALAGFDALAQSPDQLLRARAAVHVLDLRLALGRVTPQQAAGRLDALLYAWRGDRRDLAMRERLSELRQQSGAWRASLAVLREATRDFPDAASELQARLRDTFAALLRDNAVDRLPPLELVALVEENADLLPASSEGETLQARLADRLLALDLPQRAGPVLEKLMQAAPSQTARAGFGARLAALRLREGDPGGALTALLASAASELPADLAERRRLLFASATARRGDYAAALASITDLDSAEAAEARAGIMEQAQDWAGADRALADYVSKSVPPSGSLNEPQQRILLRLATAAARAGDASTLGELNARDTSRMGNGPVADMFRLLTAAPVRGTTDLPRAKQEAGLARALPAGLKALQTP